MSNSGTILNHRRNHVKFEEALHQITICAPRPVSYYNMGVGGLWQVACIGVRGLWHAVSISPTLCLLARLGAHINSYCKKVPDSQLLCTEIRRQWITSTTVQWST